MPFVCKGFMLFFVSGGKGCGRRFPYRVPSVSRPSTWRTASHQLYITYTTPIRHLYNTYPTLGGCVKITDSGGRRDAGSEAARPYFVLLFRARRRRAVDLMVSPEAIGLPSP
jgi:hypothetical protein